MGVQSIQRDFIQVIRLGYELGTGHAVDVPLDHTAVMGRTQQSGKTTTLEAMVHRSNVRAVVFLTKKDESGFRDATPIPPYFRDRADWQFVAALFEAVLNERVKFERSWIIDACAGAETLADVQRNVQDRLSGVQYPREESTGGKKKRKPKEPRWKIRPASGLSQGVFTNLNAYLDIVIPQIARLPYTQELKLNSGLNVMDLSSYSTELQSLVIRSVLEWVYEHERNVIVIIPEAWEFIPQNRRSPVLLAAEELIRKGAAAGNFVWLDSQDIAAVHKNILRSVGVWILGVQREANEIKRTLNHIPRPAPSPSEIMNLGRGEFFVCYKSVLKKIYVQPFWIDEAHAQAVALGEEGIETVEKIWREKSAERKKTVRDMSLASEILEAPEEKRNFGVETPPSPAKIETVKSRMAEIDTVEPETEDMRKNEELQKENTDLWGILTEEQKQEYLRRHHPQLVRPITEEPLLTGRHPAPLPNLEVKSIALDSKTLPAVIALLRQQPEVIELMRTIPRIVVTTRRPVLEMDDSKLFGKFCVLIADGFFDEERSGAAVITEMKRRGMLPPKIKNANSIYIELPKAVQAGVLTAEDGGYRRAHGVDVKTATR
jgi:hypothetical protein